jgi:hypothetical protein
LRASVPRLDNTSITERERGSRLLKTLDFDNKKNFFNNTCQTHVRPVFIHFDAQVGQFLREVPEKASVTIQPEVFAGKKPAHLMQKSRSGTCRTHGAAFGWPLFQDYNRLLSIVR